MLLNLFLIIKSTIIIIKLNLKIIIKLKKNILILKKENNFLKLENKSNHTVCVEIWYMITLLAKTSKENHISVIFAASEPRLQDLSYIIYQILITEREIMII